MQMVFRYIRCNACLCCLLLCGLTVKAQNNFDQTTDKPLFISLSYQYAWFQVHSDKISHYRGINFNAGELEISRLYLSDKTREVFGTVMKLACGLNYINFYHKDLGYGISSVFYFEPYVLFRPKFRLSIKGGIGLVYLSRKYDPVENPNNLVFSTNMAFPLYIGCGFYYVVHKQFQIKGNISFQHISNGSVKQPNLGVNYPALSLGVEYGITDYVITDLKYADAFQREKRIDLMCGYTLKEDTSAVNNLSVINLISQASFQFSRINALMAGLVFEYQQRANLYDENLSAGILGGHEFRLGHFLFGQQMGLYLLEGSKNKKRFFQNYYFLYKINSRLMAGVNFKAHAHVADYLSFQIGLSF